MARRIKLPDGKIANFPDDSTDAEIESFVNKHFPKKDKSFKEQFISQIKDPSTPETLKGMIARAFASPTLPSARQRVAEAKKPGKELKAGKGAKKGADVSNVPFFDTKDKVNISAIPFVEAGLTEEQMSELGAPEKFLLNLINSEPVQATRGAIEDVLDLSLVRSGLGGLARGAGALFRGAGLEKVGTGVSNVGRFVQGKKTIAGEKLAKEEATRLAENTKSVEVTQTKFKQAITEAKENAVKKKKAGESLLETLKTGTRKQKKDIVGSLDVKTIGAAVKSIKTGLKNQTIEQQVQNAIHELPLEESALLAQRNVLKMTDEILEAMKLDDPLALSNVINKQFKLAKDIDMKAILSQIEEMRIQTRGNKTLDDTITEFRRDFSKALPLEARLGKGLGVAGRGRETSKTPLTANVGSIAPEVEEAVKSVAPVTMMLSRFLRPQSVLTIEKVGTEFYDLARLVETEGASQVGRLNKIIVNEGSKYTKDRREAIGRFLDGQSEILSPAEADTARQLRRVTDFIANKAGIKKEKRVKDYLTRFIDVDDTGLPIDVIESLAHSFALEGAKQGKFGRAAADFLNNIPSLNTSKSQIAQGLFDKLDVATKSSLINRAKNTLRGQPIETYYGPLSSRRTASSKLITQDFQEVLLRYVPGAYRKIGIDKLLKFHKENSSRFSPKLLHYSSEYLDSFRGIMGSVERMTTLAFEDLIVKLESKGSSKLVISLAKSLKPREFSGFVRKWQFNAKIGGNMATALVNLSQTAINTVTEIGFKATGKAVGEYLAGGARVKRILEKRGITRQAHLGDIDPGTIDRPTKFLSFMFQQTEEFNRGVAYLAGYNEARLAGKSVKEAIRLGQKLIDDTQFVFSKANVPLNMQDPYMAILFQFKNYLWNQLQFIKRITVNAHKEPAKAARLAATLGMVGGVKAFTTVGIGSWLIAQVEETDWNDWIKDTVMFGLPGAAGIDISESLGLRIFPTAPGTPQDTQRFFREVLGPSGSAVSEVLLSGVIGETTRMLSGGGDPDPEVMKRFYRTLLKNMPVGGVAIDRFIDADEPLRGRRTRIQVEETPKERALRALFGARTTRVSKQREFQKFLEQKKDETTRRSRLIKDNIIDRLDDINSGRWTILDSAKKFGGKLEDVTLDSLGDDIIKREMPNLVREFDTLSRADKFSIRLNNPNLYKMIQEERTRGFKRLNEWFEKR